MKKLFLTALLFLSLPVYSAPGWYEGCNDNVKPYDIKEEEEYGNKLEKEYYRKRRVDPTLGIDGASYNREVMIPFLKFTLKRQDEGHTDGVKIFLKDTPETAVRRQKLREEARKAGKTNTQF